MKEINVDVVVISYAKDHELYETTKHCVESLIYSESEIVFRVFIVESNMDVTYNTVPNVKTVYPNMPFGYHKFLNYGRRLCSAPYICLCNNDLVFEKYWASSIIREMENNPALLSASPFCPEVGGERKNDLVDYGYKIWNGPLLGSCIFQQRKIYELIGDLDENFTFWCCDTDYAMTLYSMKIPHARVFSSVVHHHKEILGISAERLLSQKEKLFLKIEPFKLMDFKWPGWRSVVFLCIE